MPTKLRSGIYDKMIDVDGVIRKIVIGDHPIEAVTVEEVALPKEYLEGTIYCYANKITGEFFVYKCIMTLDSTGGTVEDIIINNEINFDNISGGMGSGGEGATTKDVIDDLYKLLILTKSIMPAEVQMNNIFMVDFRESFIYNSPNIPTDGHYPLVRGDGQADGVYYYGTNLPYITM